MAEAVESADVLVGLPAPLTYPATAGDIITSVRDQIPDQIYDSEGEPNPDSDTDANGNADFVPIRVLYRFLTNGLRTMAQLCNWFVEDFFACPSQNAQPVYTIDAKW